MKEKESYDFLIFFFLKKRRNWLSLPVFFMDSPEGNAALWGKGAWIFPDKSLTYSQINPAEKFHVLT